MLTISDDAINLIVREEDSGQAYYNQHYQHFEWPAGASGPTVGIGYDLGYCTPLEVGVDWDGIVPPDMIHAMQKGCGLKASLAAAFVHNHKYSVTVTWEQAMKEFKTREVPKWLSRIQHVVSNLELLSPDSLGALVSLAYNRGASFDLPGARFAEMRAIKHCMMTKEFSKIPDLFMSMRRLWPTGGDLWRRRGHEADLFKRGLDHA